MVADLDPTALRAAYDSDLRTWLPDPAPAGWVVEREGPLVRVTIPGQQGFIGYRELGALTGDEIDALIARQRDYFRGRGEAVEWKLHGHDLPADLPDRLVAAGFAPEDRETVVIGLAAPLASGPAGEESVARLREASARVDLERIATMEHEVWGDDRSWLVDSLAREIAADPRAITVLVAEVDGLVVSAGWVRYARGSRFATLWGGSTLAEHRRRGIYTALVRRRARLAVERGYDYLQVDASEESRPILERLGFVPVTTTTPYVYSARRPAPG